jgi:uncharacterized protein (DUF934 family)
VSDSQGPITLLRDRLETARLEAIEVLAMQDGASLADSDLLRRVVDLHGALLAVRDEIAGHSAKIGYGSEEPLV